MSFFESQFLFAKLHTPSSTAYDFLNDELNSILIHNWKNQIMQPPQPTLPTTDNSQANPRPTPIPHLSRFHHQRVPLVILVCGTACVGKSTIATQLAQRLNLPNVLQVGIKCL